MSKPLQQAKASVLASKRAAVLPDCPARAQVNALLAQINGGAGR